MSLDGIFTHALVNELNEKLAGGQLNRIDQPFPNETVLTFRANRKNYKLLLSAHPQYARAHLTQLTYQNPIQPPQFCMVLRKYLNRAHLISITQIENDRIIALRFSNRNELGDDTHLSLYVELMGRHSNIILVDEQAKKILETIRHVPKSQNSYRTLLPGAEFIPAPAQDKLNPFTETSHTILTSMQEHAEDDFAHNIQQTIQGIGRDTAKELAHLSKGKLENFQVAFKHFLERLNTAIEPTLYEAGTRTYLTPIAYQIYEASDLKTTYTSLSSLMDAYYGEKAERNHVHQLAKEIEQLLKNELEKGQKKLHKQELELKETSQADKYRIKGEVLTAYLHLVESGQSEITLPNFYDDNNPITIALDPRKKPAENAQKIFGRYQKLNARKKALHKQIALTKANNDYLESSLTQLSLARPEDIPEIRQELITEGYLKQKSKNKRKKIKKAKPRQFISSDGDLILVGRNNVQNDVLTLKKAHKSYIWLHTKDIPGSHVIIENSEPSEETILEAANLAAYFSKARASTNVPVDYVEVKHVHKPNGAKPGFVIYEGQQTVFPSPSKKLVESLKKD